MSQPGRTALSVPEFQVGTKVGPQNWPHMFFLIVGYPWSLANRPNTSRGLTGNFYQPERWFSLRVTQSKSSEYVGWLIRTVCKKFGDNWTNGTGNIDWFVFPTHSLLENKMRKSAFSAQKRLILGENKMIFPGGMNKITSHQLNQKILCLDFDLRCLAH